MTIDELVKSLRDKHGDLELADLFAEYIDGATMQSEITQILYAEMAASITGATRQQVLEMASKQAAELVTNITKQMRQTIADKVHDGLQEQKGVDWLARKLKDGLTLDVPRQKRLDDYRSQLEAAGHDQKTVEDYVDQYRKELIDQRAQTIAVTEMRMAFENGEKKVAQQRGSTHKLWTTSVLDVCTDCIANEGAGPIPINQSFPDGSDVAPAHPNCHCTVGYVTDMGDGELEQAAEEQQQMAEINQQIRESMNAAG